MFQGWGFLLGEIWVLLALAALLGLVVGWLIWGRAPVVAPDTGETDRLRADLSACRARTQAAEAQVATLTADLAAARAAAQVAPAEAAKPLALAAPRGGKADDLKLIKGIGPKLEELCNRLGFWHFDQIAAWTPAEIAWVDENLEAFKGRVTRDDWVAQARVLAAETR
jgi:predicted flap endonuclease-1-like 5' DNA nuclease